VFPNFCAEKIGNMGRFFKIPASRITFLTLNLGNLIFSVFREITRKFCNSLEKFEKNTGICL
jgi:hypothetical protein